MQRVRTPAPTQAPLLGRIPAADHLPDGVTEDCPCRPLLDRLSDRWSASVIALLAVQPLCHGELQRGTGASRKVLTQTLRALERDGIVVREVLPDHVVRVRYSLTEIGRTLEEPLSVLRDWAEQHLPALALAQQAYDGKSELVDVTQIRQHQARETARATRA